MEEKVLKKSKNGLAMVTMFILLYAAAIDSQTVQGRVELRYSIDVFVHEIGRIVGVGVLYVLLAGREA